MKTESSTRREWLIAIPAIDWKSNVETSTTENGEEMGMANGQNQQGQGGQGQQGQQGNQQQGQGGQQQGKKQQRNVTLSELEIVSGPDRTGRGTLRTIVRFGDRPYDGEILFSMDNQNYLITRTNKLTGEAVCNFSLPDDNEHRFRANVVGQPAKETLLLPVRIPAPSAAPAFKTATYATAWDSEDRDGNATIFAYADREGFPAKGTPVKFTSRGTSVTRYIDADGYAEYPFHVNMGDPVFEVKVNIPKTDEPENANFIYERRNLQILRWGGRTLLASLILLLVNLWAFGSGVQPVVKNEPNQVLQEVERLYFGKKESAIIMAPVAKKEPALIAFGQTLPDLAWGLNYWVFIAGALMFFPGLAYYTPYFLRKVAKLAINRQEKSRALIRGQLKTAKTDAERSTLMGELKQAGMTTMIQHVINFIREVVAVSLFH